MPARSEGASRSPHRLAYGAAAWIVGLFLAMQLYPADDGLRHVGEAFAEDFAGWGEVYPHSVYQQHGDYNPWLGHDLLLRGLARALSLLPLSRLAAQHLLAELLTVVFVVGLLVLASRRARVAEVVDSGHGLVVALLLSAILLGFAAVRFGTIRPFCYGSLFVVYAVGRQRFFAGLLATAALSFLYPYLAWMYAAPVALAHLLRGSRRFALGVVCATVAALALQPASFWSLVVEVARSGARRAPITTVAVTEFGSMADHLLLYGFFIGGWLLLAPWFGERLKRLSVEQLLLVFFLPVTLKHIRYLLDVELVLLFVAYGKDIVSGLAGPLANLTSFWRHLLRRKPRPLLDEGLPPRSSPLVRAVLVIGYAGCLALMTLTSLGRHRANVAFADALDPLPRGATVLTVFNLQYRLLFARPDLRLVPSSELGFYTQAIRDEYVGFFNRGEVCPLAHVVGARFFVESRGSYIDPLHARCLVPARVDGDAGQPRIWRVTPPEEKR